MKVGFNLMNLSPRLYPQVAAKAEELGFDSCWQAEHLIWPATMPPEYPYSEDGFPPVNVNTPTFDPWVNLALAAATTTKLRLGTAVYILPLRHPFITARAVATLDFASRGRVLVGVGVGWLSDEFDLMGLDFKQRGAMTDECITILKRLWTEPLVEHHGKHYSFAPVSFQPKPTAKPHPPIIVGGDSDAALKRAARLGDGWIAIGRGAGDELASRVQLLRRLRAECGRQDEPFEVIAGAQGGTLDEIRRLEEQGATSVTVRPWTMPERGSPNLEHAVSGMEAYAERVLVKL